ncbi:MAG TPA: gamma-glutamylcyclotransferase [Polyangiales bacterium]|nr:gamma-glutamylcyclotransferase [Polyangiales bacterium]
MGSDDDVWIFGYGSLIFRPDFPFIARREGYICGWARRFWQASTDHRGTPVHPGRVVTLVPVVDAKCWGVAYCVAGVERTAVLDRLDARERNGYQRQVLSFFDREGPAGQVIVYVADRMNPSFVGPESIEETARVVRSSSGPSGPNREYVSKLAAALEAMGAADDHVAALARAVADR